MKWPKLVPDAVCTTPIRIVWEDGVDADGVPNETTVFEGMCNYAEHTRHMLDERRQMVQLAAVVLISGDPLPGRSLTGTVRIGEDCIRHRILHSSRARNPDGTVNFTKLELV